MPDAALGRRRRGPGREDAGGAEHRREYPGLKAHRRRSRALSRKRSANRGKVKAHLARIATIRRDATHKATTRLARGWRRIVVEDLNVPGIAANRRLARSVMDGGFHEFRRRLDYKAKDQWRDGDRRAPLVSLEQDLFGLRFGPGRTGPLAAPPAAWRSTGISTRCAILSNWPQALRLQPVEGRAPARPPPAPRGSGPVA